MCFITSGFEKCCNINTLNSVQSTHCLFKYQAARNCQNSLKTFRNFTPNLTTNSFTPTQRGLKQTDRQTDRQYTKALTEFHENTKHTTYSLTIGLKETSTSPSSQADCSDPTNEKQSSCSLTQTYKEALHPLLIWKLLEMFYRVKVGQFDTTEQEVGCCVTPLLVRVQSEHCAWSLVHFLQS